MDALLLVALAVAVAYALYRFYPTSTRRWFRRIATARQALWAFFLLAFAATMLASGSTVMVLFGAVVVGYAVLYYLFEDPFAPITDRLGI